MKKFILAMVILILILFTGCQRMKNVEISNNSDLNNIEGTDSTSMPEGDIYKLLEDQGLKCDEALIELYTNILSSEASFNSNDYGSGVEEIITLKDLKVAEDAPLYPICYSLVDMNGDDIPELLVSVTTGNVDFTIVFHSSKGVVKSYWFSNRQLSQLKSDGTFRSSGGAGYNRIAKIDFIEDGYELIQLACYDAGTEFDEEGNAIVNYYLNEDKVTEAEFEAYMNAFDEKPEAIWVDITR